MQRIDFAASLERAVRSLEKAVAAMEASPESDDDVTRGLMRDGVIQRFEFTFELAWKFMRRFLRLYGLERADNLTNRELFRLAAEYGIVHDAEAWFDMLQARNRTSHIYDEDTANEVYRIAVASLTALTFLVERLRESRE